MDGEKILMTFTAGQHPPPSLPIDTFFEALLVESQGNETRQGIERALRTACLEADLCTILDWKSMLAPDAVEMFDTADTPSFTRNRIQLLLDPGVWLSSRPHTHALATHPHTHCFDISVALVRMREWTCVAPTCVVDRRHLFRQEEEIRRSGALNGPQIHRGEVRPV